MSVNHKEANTMKIRNSIAILAGVAGFVAVYYAVLFYTDIQWQQHPFDVGMSYFVLRNSALLYAGLGALIAVGLVLALSSGIGFASKRLFFPRPPRY